MGDERIFLKTGRDADFNKDYRMSLISTGSILLDSTFNILCRGFKMKCFTIFDQKSVNFFHILSYLILVWIRIRIQQNTRIRMQCTYTDHVLFSSSCLKVPSGHIGSAFICMRSGSTCKISLCSFLFVGNSRFVRQRQLRRERRFFLAT
jgi:hypothetical protein